MNRIADSAIVLALLSLVCLAPSRASALIMVGRGNQPVPGAGWPAGALAQMEGHEILVEVEPKGGSKVGSWGGSAKVKDDGTFEFSNVPPGEYRITSRPNPSNSNRQYAPEQVVTVAPGERTNVKVIYE